MYTPNKVVTIQSSALTITSPKCAWYFCPQELQRNSLHFTSKQNHFTYILIIKTNEMHNFSNLFDKILYMFRTGPLSIIGTISTLYTRNRYL